VKVLFFGYSQMGYRAVELLAERGDEVTAVVTHRDDPHENRWYKTPAEAAARHGLPILYAEDLGRDGVVALAESSSPDLILSVFYRDMLPARVLEKARITALNLHPSLLPAYRGRAPINWVLVRGERETGVTLHHMVARADAGDIVAQRSIPIASRETALSLYLKVEEAGVELLRGALPLLATGRAPRRVQDESRASVVGRRRPEDGRIDWAWPAERIDCLVRAVAPPWPGAFAEILGRRIEIHAGEPAEPLPPGTPPGTVRREPGRLLVAAGDRWFRIDAGEGIEIPDASFELAREGASPSPLEGGKGIEGMRG
jgi:methionyl-tRNA formyltransferase